MKVHIGAPLGYLMISFWWLCIGSGYMEAQAGPGEFEKGDSAVLCKWIQEDRAAAPQADGPRVRWGLESLSLGAIENISKLMERESTESLLVNLASFYRDREYTADEFLELLRSFSDLLSKRFVSQGQPSLQGQIDIIPNEDGHHANRLILFSDPACSKCSETLMFLQRLGADLDGIAVALVPTAEPLSRFSAAALALVEQNNPAQVGSALDEFLNILPSNTDLARELIDHHLPMARSWFADDPTDAELFEFFVSHPISDRFDRNIGFLDELRASPPIIIYRHRVVLRKVRHKVPFDPFRDINHLCITLTAIDALRN